MCRVERLIRRVLLVERIRYRSLQVSPLSWFFSSNSGFISGASAALIAAFPLLARPPAIGTPVAIERTTLLTVRGTSGGGAGAGVGWRSPIARGCW
jgi:hypothetical protein